MCNKCLLEFSLKKKGSEIWRCDVTDMLVTRRKIYKEVDKYLNDIFVKVTIHSRSDLLEYILVEYRNIEDKIDHKKMSFYSFVVFKLNKMRYKKTSFDLKLERLEQRLSIFFRKHLLFYLGLMIALLSVLVLLISIARR
jgi:hypothetical protein